MKSIKPGSATLLPGGWYALGLLVLWLLSGCGAGFKLEDAVPIEKPKLAKPLLWTGEGPLDGHVLDPSGFNGDSETISETKIDYIGTLNQDDSYRGSPAEQAEIRLIRHVGGSTADLAGELRLNFEGDTLDYVVRQMLGGFLGINYIAVEELVGTVTFRTEVPIRRSQVLPIVRSILAQNGYLMKTVSGVMHIGRAERIAMAENLVETGRQGDLVTRFIPLGGEVNSSMVQTLASIVPEGVNIGPAPDGKSLFVRASAEDVAQVETLVNGFVSGGMAQSLFAIIYLKESAPDAMAEQLMSFFGSQTMAGTDKPNTILPLDGHQALLITATSTAAIDNVRRMVNQLDYRLEDATSLRIIPLRHVDAGVMAGQLSSAFSMDEPYPARSVPVNAEGAADAEAVPTEGAAPSAGKEPPDADRVQAAFKEAQSTSRSAESEAPSIIPDTRNNALLVRSSYRTYKRIAEAVKLLDIPISQVVIEATILEVKITELLKYGVQWYLSGSGFTVRSSQASGVDDSTLTGLVGTVEQLVSGISVSAVVDALDDVTDVKVVSSPYLTVMDRKTARLVVGDQIPFITSSQSTSSSAGDVAITQEIVTRDTGVILEVTPVVRGDNSIELTITQEISSPVVASSTNANPTIATRQITSDVMVYSGRTVLLGGLIQDRQDDLTVGVPVLRKAPVLGKLFEQTSQTATRTEVIVLITPRVTRKASEIEQITDLLRTHLNVNGSYPDAPPPDLPPQDSGYVEPLD